ncbi:helix-turn-helix domain-containing protein [Sorangium cellulosum]|uniref:helix-turn-helix domain-containing protein n=1 Tax=Sorangium cellulosum TaxID=56 RepID=UPI001010B0E8
MVPPARPGGPRRPGADRLIRGRANRGNRSQAAARLGLSRQGLLDEMDRDGRE